MEGKEERSEGESNNQSKRKKQGERETKAVTYRTERENRVTNNRTKKGREQVESNGESYKKVRER